MARANNMDYGGSC